MGRVLASVIRQIENGVYNAITKKAQKWQNPCGIFSMKPTFIKEVSYKHIKNCKSTDSQEFSQDNTCTMSIYQIFYKGGRS